ncbi:cryptochrome/photolyase family protein [Bacillus sp. FJAT-45037]|uniref:cryptochrome/photolyase family protein n=1 Tax=Bacillus sp. FJAT-45037 TaxID=2011007 RepID=UPI000C242949|nr:deoxyribodipyrimidine photo-lyase [Bacillus sp. FJAT-45037]
MHKKVAVWFRRDFRFHDQTALNEAVEQVKLANGKWFAFFYLDPKTADATPIHHDYFFQTVLDFKKKLQELGGDLHIVTGEIEEALEAVLYKHNDLDGVFVNDDRVGEGCKRDDAAEEYLATRNIPIYRFEDAYLTTPDQVLKKDGHPYKVFTPYYKAWRSEQKRVPRSLSTKIIQAYLLKSEVIDDKAEELFNLIVSSCKCTWGAIGESHAIQRLQTFIDERLSEYERHRDYPGIVGTSRLSPYLKTGVLSVRSVFHHVIESEANSHSADVYISELAWRDFYRMIHFYHPKSKEKEVMSRYREIKWGQEEERLEQWKLGQTGFPIVDAAMRQLRKEGWMHNRMRMITASFLTKDYLLDWRLGERYFEEMLIDYDASSNIGGWQWAASVGTDPVPYFRIFNPITQSKRFDEQGVYIRHYLPELNKVPDKYIHEPWKMDRDEQENYHCVINEDYPAPTVDHSIQRKKAISLFKDGE